MEKTYLKLQPSESVVVHAAAAIYSGYLAAGKVSNGQESAFIEKSVKEAVQIAISVDKTIQSDDEVL